MKLFIPLLSILILSCQMYQQDKFDLQGHRGARGLYPENNIPGFLFAIDQGVTTLELDLAVSKDQQVVISHEPYMSSTYCLDPEGNEIPDSLERSHNIYQMDYAQIKTFDCGTKPHPGFPEQKKIPAYKPLLTVMIDSVESYLMKNDLLLVNYNIEIKSSEKSDNIFHPSPGTFSDLVYQTINEKLPWSRVNIQSFDFRVLQYFNQTYPNVTLSLLIGNDLGLTKNLDSLGFTPDIYSCHHSLVTQDLVKGCHDLNMKIIPWTVNETADMEKLVALGVDGLITDYPDRFPQK
ncbi:MAG: glycerophosphodiester phosphodiesterase family protein [Cyclobacteriaceae bacterium]